MRTHNMPIARPIRVLVVDDHTAIRIGVCQLIEAESPGMCCVGAAATTAQALQQTQAHRPDIVVLDVDLAGEDGLALIRLLHDAAPCAVVVLTSLTDLRVGRRALQLGAVACLSKTAPAADLIAAIVAAARPSETPHASGSPSNPGSGVSRGDGTSRLFE